MQRQTITLEALAARDNLALATWKAAKGKSSRPAVARFLADLDRQLAALAEAILEERAPLGRATCFTIHDPKRRTIHAACFADRVLHHAILNLAEARFERMLVDGTYACRPGKGVHAAVLAVQRGLRSRPWFVQVDVDAYFPSIRHDLLLELLRRRFRGEPFLRLLERILDRAATNGPSVGLPIGSLTSQHFANAFLDSADRLLLAEPGCGCVVRYMDDLFWVCDDRRVAETSLAALRAHLLEQRGLTLKSSVRIARSEQGTRFCGFRVRQGVVLASPRRMSRYRAALARIGRAADEGVASDGELQRAVDAALATLCGCRSDAFRRRVLEELGAARADAVL
ncbi:RNA-directed DNA polymerase [Accumulibacter sp.]|uniref:RNA-directed DNA polymerase n=1 Tax=Accumulibacter sp. TaxID=2053492 RepID=UPI0025ECF680|nr:RNA-directed DNA polymerase [Accumulibacter sp.]MCM8595754.1 RNA-directed DNA polymerase [Accumulibacter sp.]MCM8626603.1 RNA-directed DNA polymerase [Accumulibacter sp.]MDS4049902.1 RNA-directed DNA polymerase [Accumulibacter sp.]